MIKEQDNDRIKRLCMSKFKVRADSVCVAATPQHGLKGNIQVEGEGKIAVVVDGLILGVAPHAGIWRVHELLPHFKPGPKEWRGALDYRAWDPSNLRKCTRLAKNLAKCCQRQLDVSGDSLECRWHKRRRDD